jgi:hypothetical protein
MTRRLQPKHRWLFFALGAALVLSMLPTRWLGWTKDVAAIVALPITPFTHVGTQLSAWLRPAATPLDALTGDSLLALEKLALEKDYAEAQLVAAKMRIDELEQQVAQLQLAQRYSSGRPVRLLLADITGHSPNLSLDVVSLNCGSHRGVHKGAIAVHAGVHLIGRVMEVDALRSLLVPITSPAMRELLDAVIMPGGDADAPMEQAARVQLAQRSDGAFIAVVDRELKVERGDIARLADARWPAAAQAMIIGTVQAVESIEDQPLRRRLVVRPMYRAHELASVTLKIELDDEMEASVQP